MKRILKKLLHRFGDVPLIGRPFRIAAAVYRLPEFSEQLMQLRRNIEQPSLEASKQDLNNLAISVPVALRKLRRDVDLLLMRSDQER